MIRRVSTDMCIADNNVRRDGYIKNNNFNSLRLLAAFFVITGHMYILNGEAAPAVCGHGVKLLAKFAAS